MFDLSTDALITWKWADITVQSWDKTVVPHTVKEAARQPQTNCDAQQILSNKFAMPKVRPLKFEWRSEPATESLEKASAKPDGQSNAPY